MRSVRIGLLHFLRHPCIATVLLVGLCVSGVLPGQTGSEGQVVTLVDSYKVRVRATPEILDDNILASLFKGTQLPLLGEQGGWYQVSLPDSEVGWVYSNFGKVEQARDQLEAVFEIVVVRAGPSTNSEKVARAIQGQRLHLLGERGGWYQVEIPNETRGWVRADTVISKPVTTDSLEDSSEEPPSEGEEAVQKAARQAPETPAEVPSPQASGVEEETSTAAEVAESATPPAATEGPKDSEADGAFPSVTEIGSDWLAIVGLAAGITALLVAALAFYRRKRLVKLNAVVKQGRQSKTSELERSLRGEIEKTENRLSLLDKQVQGRLTEFRSSSPEAESLGSKTSEDMLANLEELRKVIENQQERLNLYSELVSLQNEQIETYKEENASIRKLLAVIKDA